MFQLFAKIINFFLSHKFSFEIASMGAAGIILPELAALDHVIKILIGCLTLLFIVRKELRERQKQREEKYKKNDHEMD